MISTIAYFDDLLSSEKVVRASLKTSCRQSQVRAQTEAPARPEASQAAFASRGAMSNPRKIAQRLKAVRSGGVFF